MNNAATLKIQSIDLSLFLYLPVSTLNHHKQAFEFFDWHIGMGRHFQSVSGENESYRAERIEAGKSFAIGCNSECGFHHASKAGIVNLFSTPRDLFFKTAVPVARDYGNNLLIGCKSTRAFKVNEPCKEDQK